MYTDYYGLSEPPFQLTPDARYWFDSRTHKKAMAYLGYGLAQGEGFIAVTGEVGAGKSTLVAHLLATIDRERLNAISLVSTQVEGDDMLRLVAHGLGLVTHAAAKADLLDSVERALSEEARRGRRTLIIVDEAQNLTHSALEELRMLSNFTSQGRALVQIFLLGQPEFRDRLAADPSVEQVRQRVIANHHLGPIEAGEVEAYIVHRLGIAGWDGRPSFRAATVQALYRHSGGIPRRLNQLANRLLLFAALEQLDTIEEAHVESVAADLAADRPQAGPANTASTAQAAPARSAEPVRDLALERRVAALETQLEEQEKIVRRVLTLLVEWVENGQQAPGYTHAA
jgi:putative secretion ATPase (PEP-CTERM system associated)